MILRGPLFAQIVQGLLTSLFKKSDFKGGALPEQSLV